MRSARLRIGIVGGAITGPAEVDLQAGDSVRVHTKVKIQPAGVVGPTIEGEVELEVLVDLVDVTVEEEEV